ncbi:MAG TPA: phage tail spike protein, partial [Desulfobacteria bacterium]|nr:phage tail spike protein [Desulfobacteria bacterium]
PNAFVNRWGGEIERDNITVRMKQHIGEDRGVSIRYRKNLTGLQLDADRVDIITRIYPTGRKADGQTLLTLPEKYVDSPLIGNYVKPIVRRIDYPDIQVVDKVDDSHPELVTEEQAYEKLRAAAAAEFAAGKDRPTLSATVEFVPLETTEEYKNLAVLEKVYLGDTVHIYHEPMKIELTAKVSSYDYDCLMQRYQKIILGCVPQMIGTPKSVVGQGIIGAQQSADHAQDSADTAQKTANDAKQEIELANVTIGKLNVRITATEEGLESKVSKDDISSEIQQHPADVVFAFNNVNGSTQAIKFTGDGFDFYNGETLLGHIGVALDSATNEYEFCIQPVGGHSTYFADKGGYALICMGAIKATSLAADGLISTYGYIQGVHKASSGAVGKSELLPLMFSDGSKHNVIFEDGLYVSRD